MNSTVSVTEDSWVSEDNKQSFKNKTGAKIASPVSTLVMLEYPPDEVCITHEINTIPHFKKARGIMGNKIEEVEMTPLQEGTMKGSGARTPEISLEPTNNEAIYYQVDYMVYFQETDHNSHAFESSRRSTPYWHLTAAFITEIYPFLQQTEVCVNFGDGLVAPPILPSTPVQLFTSLPEYELTPSCENSYY